MIITILRKPLEGSVAENTLKHGCGAINIDATRISTSDNLNGGAYAENPTERHDRKENWRYERGGAGDYEQPSGRWPANFILIGDSSVEELDRQSGVSKSTGGRLANISNTSSIYGGGKGLGQNLSPDSVKGDPGFGDEGGASRFFKQFKKGNEK